MDWLKLRREQPSQARVRLGNPRRRAALDGAAELREPFRERRGRRVRRVVGEPVVERVEPLAQLGEARDLNERKDDGVCVFASESGANASTAASNCQAALARPGARLARAELLPRRRGALRRRAVAPRLRPLVRRAAAALLSGEHREDVTVTCQW